jgi:pSer/pThr/pTyr-binding forkhead associated (FHA) protein
MTSRAGRGSRAAHTSDAHAALHFDGGRWWVEDLGSTNGTYVNEARVTGRAPLRPGDVVQFGLIAARFQA